MNGTIKQSDVIVLGAGIIGVSVALHLQARGRSVTLIDKGEPGSETSHGNAGLIERSSVIPYAFPRDLGTILRYAANRSTAVRYQPAALARMLPWLARYWWHSAPARLDAIAAEMLPLIERCIDEHMVFADAAGATQFMRGDGWLELYRTRRDFEQAVQAAEKLGAYRLAHAILDREALAGREPSLQGDLAGAVHWRDPVTVSDPGAVTRAYAGLFAARGGEIAKGDARTLQPDGGGWLVEGHSERYRAPQAVAALGPWSSELCRRFGYSLPLAVKRGYHMHYRAAEGAALRLPVCDVEAGFMLTPMARGIRLTTGIELAERDAPADARQVAQAEQIARRFFPLGEAIDPAPWRGARPCLPDMKPVIGKAPRHDGLWFAFGHAHHGFTLGPVTGRLLGEMMTGEAPFTDPRPYAPERFDA
jgi:D-amino-acid dehydrogenase